MKIKEQIKTFKENQRVKKVNKEFNKTLPPEALEALYKNHGDEQANQAVRALWSLLETESKRTRRMPWEIL